MAARRIEGVWYADFRMHFPNAMRMYNRLMARNFRIEPTRPQVPRRAPVC